MPLNQNIKVIAGWDRLPGSDPEPKPKPKQQRAANKCPGRPHPTPDGKDYISKLPIELHWLIAEQLRDLRAIRKLSYTNKTLYAHLDGLCYTGAAKGGLALLAWAVQGDMADPARANAAKKYLSMGGGWDKSCRQVWAKKEFPIMELESTKMRRQLRQGMRRPDQQIFRAYLKTELAIVLAQLFRAQGWMTQPVERRLGWVKLIFKHARGQALAAVGKVGLFLLFCWMCQHFDFSSVATIECYRIMMRKLRKKLTGTFASFPKLTSSDSESWGSNSILTHLLLSLSNIDDHNQKITSSFIELVKELISSKISRVEESTLTLLVDWHQSYAEAFPMLGQSTDNDFMELLLILSRQLMKQKEIPASDESDFLGQVTLVCACQRGDEAAVQRLLDLGVDINTRQETTLKTPIMEAGTHDMFEFLRLCGADINARDNHGTSNVLCSAIIQRCASGRAPEHWLEESFLNRLRLILDRNRDLVNIPGERGGPLPIYLAFNGGSHGKAMWYPGIKLLLEYGADLNRSFRWRGGGRNSGTEYVSRPLHAAMQEQKPRNLVHFLIEKGADPMETDERGNTAYGLPNADWYRLPDP